MPLHRNQETIGKAMFYRICLENSSQVLTHKFSPPHFRTIYPVFALHHGKLSKKQVNEMRNRRAMCATWERRRIQELCLYLSLSIRLSDGTSSRYYHVEWVKQQRSQCHVGKQQGLKVKVINRTLYVNNGWAYSNANSNANSISDKKKNTIFLDAPMRCWPQCLLHTCFMLMQNFYSCLCCWITLRNILLLSHIVKCS